MCEVLPHQMDHVSTTVTVILVVRGDVTSHGQALESMLGLTTGSRSV
jgi:hypothetical protein